MSREELYDRVYSLADKLFKKYSPCNIHTNKNGRVVCNTHKYSHNDRLCCKWCHSEGGCKYWSKSNLFSKGGCTTNCLKCKLYWCNEGGRGEKIKEFEKRLYRLKRFTNNHDLPLIYFSSKEEVFELETVKI